MHVNFATRAANSIRRLSGLAAMLLLAACSQPGEEPAASSATPRAGQPEPDTASAPSAQREERAVVSDRLPYGEIGTELVYGHFVFPSDMVEPLPAVILVHEWWGLNDAVRAAADRLAAQGYIVLAVDLFDGKTTTDLQTARAYMLGVVNDEESAAENIRQAMDFVRETAGAPGVAVMGWGLGGSWALNAAMLFPDELDASVIYYGQVSNDPDRLTAVNVPILGFFGEADRGVPVREVRAFEATLDGLGREHEVIVYPGARHGFANTDAGTYDAGLAERAWERTLGFLAETLYSDDS